MTKNRLVLGAVRCGAMRCDEVVGGALPCFSQIQGSSLVSVCVWFMRKIEGPKEVGWQVVRRAHAAVEGKRSVEKGRCRRRAVRCDVGRVFRLLVDLPCRHAASGCREASSQMRGGWVDVSRVWNDEERSCSSRCSSSRGQNPCFPGPWQVRLVAAAVSVDVRACSCCFRPHAPLLTPASLAASRCPS